jgi:hypothetical protein
MDARMIAPEDMDAAAVLDCGHAPTWRLGHPYAPDAATRTMVVGTGTVDARVCRCECGELYVDHGVGTGTATDPDTGRTYCYPCAGDLEAARFAASDRWLAYDAPVPGSRAGDPHALTTWTGRELARVTRSRIGRGGFGSRVVYLRAVAPDGSEWYGRHSADWCEAVTLHRVKGGAR